MTPSNSTSPVIEVKSDSRADEAFYEKEKAGGSRLVSLRKPQMRRLRNAPTPLKRKNDADEARAMEAQLLVEFKS